MVSGHVASAHDRCGLAQGIERDLQGLPAAASVPFEGARPVVCIGRKSAASQAQNHAFLTLTVSSREMCRRVIVSTSCTRANRRQNAEARAPEGISRQRSESITAPKGVDARGRQAAGYTGWHCCPRGRVVRIVWILWPARRPIMDGRLERLTKPSFIDGKQ